MQKMPFVCLIFLITCMAFSGCGRKEEIKTLRVAIPYSDYIQDPETNYCIKWLENKTGLQLEIIDIYSNRVSEYLDTLFLAESDVDVILFGGRFSLLTIPGYQVQALTYIFFRLYSLT